MTLRPRLSRRISQLIALPCLLLGLAACSSHPALLAERATGLQVLSVAPARLLQHPASGGQGFAAACQAWQLDTQQVAHFFALATPYPEAAHHRFHYLPCEITGELQFADQPWQYRINAAATAVWEHAGQQRRFACTQPGCVPLVLMLPDLGEP